MYTFHIEEVQEQKVAKESTNKTKWLLDSGASTHMSRDYSGVTVQKQAESRLIKVANGS